MGPYMGTKEKGTFKIKLSYPGLDINGLTGMVVGEPRTWGLFRVKINHYAELLL